MPLTKIGQVTSCAPNKITILVTDLRTFEENKAYLQIGSFMQIAQGNSDYTIATIRNINGSQPAPGATDWVFEIDTQPVGTLIDGKHFERGASLLPVPTEPAYVPQKLAFDQMFAHGNGYDFALGRLSLNKDVILRINGDRFFAKHVAVVGSTGSGKSCAVAKIIQTAVGLDESASYKNNSHVVIFDIHDEYTAAFSGSPDKAFTLNRLDTDNLCLPYWLMNSEELESIFIESNEQNSYNQVSIFKQAVILNKERHNPSIGEITYDMPVYFSIKEVYNYVDNMNKEVIGRLDGEDCPKLSDGTLIRNRQDRYFTEKCSFVSPSQAKADRAGNGPFHGEFNRFVSRLETKLSDRRLRFLLHPVRQSTGTPYETADFEELLKQFIGYIDRSNVTVVDLSGIPFEVLSITVSLVSRLIFDFCFHYSKLRYGEQALNDVPVMVVCEEAHNYIPQGDQVAYRSSRKSLERIAKEGRKYGLSLMVVSQRPSEVSETIFAQCNNFVALRLTNSADQAYVKRLFPDNSNAIADILPSLAPGECIFVGDAILLPSVVQLPLPVPEPHSQSVSVHKEWQEPWRDITFADVIGRWRKE